MTLPSRRRRARVLALSSALALVGGGLVATSVASASADSEGGSGARITSTGLRPGQIKHVWLIILENKSYDATFTGLNQNSYIWKTLPSQGALLTNYYGTSHYSMGNYISMVSGQSAQADTQSDCSVSASNFGSNSSIITSGTDAGQVASLAGANAANGKNGCVYPSQTATLFNQLDAAGKTWKGYAQDLGNQTGRDAGACGYPGTSANNADTNPTQLSTPSTFPSGVTSFTGAQSNDQYVAKHFPFPWFHSLTGSTKADGTSTAALTTPVQGGSDCDSAHIANLDSATNGLFTDLRSASTTPAFSWITPNNCSDAHDAVCKGNNLSGAFDASGNPVYQSTPNPQAYRPANYTGGLYASDLFLRYYIPMIEKSPAFRDGGLIDVTFDEANPPFTYTGNSFANANAYGPTLADQPNASAGLTADAAGQNIRGKNVSTEPQGPNSTLEKDAAGNQLYPGAGYNAFIDRPPACTSTSPNVPANCVPGIVRGGSGTTPVTRSDKVGSVPGSTYLLDPSIVATDTGRIVVDATGKTLGFVGTVSDTGPQPAATSSSPVVSGSFQLVDQNGTPVVVPDGTSSITLSAEAAPGYAVAGQTTVDPLYNATDPTPGGGNTGSVLISPLIKPGTTSAVYYNHYSWLRTMEDVFGVASGTARTKLAAGTVSGGIDGQGHLGYAAQSGLAPFGRDVFTNVGERHG